ncbi:hypothetical protein LPJ73_006102, partial [Coemansia sp. RSA 2703]
TFTLVIFGSDNKFNSESAKAVSALLNGLLDHTIDNRGDVGSWVRKQCLVSLAGLFESDSLLLTRLSDDRDLVLRLLGRALQSATEKIDKLRAAAGSLLEIVLHAQKLEGLDRHICLCIDELRRVIPPANANHSKEDA